MISTKVILYSLLPCFLFAGCSASENTYLKEGFWRGSITISGNKTLPFIFEIEYTDNDTLAYLINDTERIKIDDLSISGDSLKLPMHIFDAALVAKISGDSLNGFFIKYYEDDFRLPFKAEYGTDERFPEKKDDPSPFTGEWAVTFTDPKNTIFAIGDFNASGNAVTGTFRLATGDYRFLEGAVIDDTLRLTTFDGNHAYLFQAVALNDSTLAGGFWSGKSYYASWMGIKDPTAKLPSSDTLTYLKPGFEKLEFTFLNLDSNLVSVDDYLGKALIVQIFGTWCPNCMDETKFLSQWYNDNKDKPVEIVGLAYEMKDDFSYARSRVLRMKEKLGVEYDFLIAGTDDKEAASKTLPMLNSIVSFPTLIFIDKNGKIKKIHTGFSGPGTGKHYELFKEDFNNTVKQLLTEPE